MPEEEQKEVQGKPKSKLLFIILPLVIVLLAGGGAAAYFMFARPSVENPSEKKKEEVQIFYEMPTFMVNLADPGGKRFLKATVGLKLSSQSMAEECKLRNFELRDIVLTILASKESEDINKSEDKTFLKTQILEALNKVLHKGQILDVYFVEFLIQ